VINNQQQTVVGSPKHKGPPGSVPKSAKSHCNKQVEPTPRRSFAIASKRNIDIIPQKSRKCYVPAGVASPGSQVNVGRSERTCQQWNCTIFHVEVTAPRPRLIGALRALTRTVATCGSIFIVFRQELRMMRVGRRRVSNRFRPLS
jgi:hypothetical protein